MASLFSGLPEGPARPLSDDGDGDGDGDGDTDDNEAAIVDGIEPLLTMASSSPSSAGREKGNETGASMPSSCSPVTRASADHRPLLG